MDRKGYAFAGVRGWAPRMIEQMGMWGQPHTPPDLPSVRGGSERADEGRGAGGEHQFGEGDVGSQSLRISGDRT